MPPKNQLPTPSADTPAPKGTKRKRGESERASTKPVHYITSGESLITGRATEFSVGNKKFSIHDTLSKANSPYISDLLKKAKKESTAEVSIPADSGLFRYFHNWLYDKDGSFSYKALEWHRSETCPGYPYNPLIGLYMLAHELRVPSFANAVLQKAMVVRQDTNQVCDESTINLLYDEHLQLMPIHTLFVDMVAFHVHRDDVLDWDKLEFLRCVAHRLVVLRDDSGKTPSQPRSSTYFITDIPDPVSEAMEADDDDDDDCVIISSNLAPNTGRTSRAATVKRERSAQHEA
ncbi:hypothetical protein EG328_009121 [Venturia inaequalis]|uniref:BTB domain-containing protein n=1 Tax=Venturia inaequalis TaxID=5025 RepID=A0A8H3UAV0_VENIN|nr:hypothetical protein EG328_009121 [Venturia inaequalis]